MEEVSDDDSADYSPCKFFGNRLIIVSVANHVANLYCLVQWCSWVRHFRANIDVLKDKFKCQHYYDFDQPFNVICSSSPVLWYWIQLSKYLLGILW
jgi:hypothetical protein